MRVDHTVGEVLGKRLESKGFDKAYVVLGQFLLLKKDKDLFTEWIKVKKYKKYNFKSESVVFSLFRTWPVLTPSRVETATNVCPTGATSSSSSTILCDF